MPLSRILWVKRGHTIRVVEKHPYAFISNTFACLGEQEFLVFIDHFPDLIQVLVLPELHWRWGYFTCLLLMFAITVVLLFYFKRKRWL